MKTKQILTAGAIALSMILTGCSASSTGTKDTKTTEVAKKEVKTIGQKTKDSKSLKMTNNTGKKITVFETKSSSEESKKNNTASTSSNSNKNNSSSSNSKPAEHTHNWVAQYKTVNVPEKGHNEQVLVQAAYDEQVPVTEMKEHSICNQCGADITADPWGHNKQHALNYEAGGFRSVFIEEVTGYNTVHHDAVYETRYVVDSPATTKQELTGYKCSGCGKTRAN